MMNNYPIKYAVIPMIEQVGWTHGGHELERKYGVVCYIVSKCYLVNEEINYKKDGRKEKIYRVVCPFEDKDYGIWSRIVPSFNYFSGNCTNSTITDNVYDTREEALLAKNKKNNDISFEQKKFIFDSNKLKEIDKDFNKTLSYYEKLEKLIDENTTDLEVNNEIKEQSFVTFDKDEISKSACTLYDIINLNFYDKNNYVIYNLSINEYAKLQESIRNKTINIEEYTHTPLIIHKSNNDVIKLLSNDGEEKYMTIGDDVRLVGNINFKSVKSPDRIIFTLENYNDVINSYGFNKNSKTLKLERE